MISSATGPGTASSTRATQPASSSARAPSTSSRAACAVLPCVLKPPSIVADCGVRPMWPTTAIPACTIARARETIGPAPSSLTTSARRLLDEADRVPHGVLVAHLVRAERHVADDDRPVHRAGDRPGQEEHLVHRHRDRRALVAEHDHRRRVADEDHVDPRVLGEARARHVVRRHHHDPVAAALHLGELGEGKLSCGDTHVGHLSSSRGTLSMRRVEPARTAAARVGGSNGATAT